MFLDKQEINEAENPAYVRPKSNGPQNLRAIWAEIDRSQKELQQLVYGDLDKDLYDITKQKARRMGVGNLVIPHTLCDAGNTKLPSNVLIVNMSSSLMCPSYYLGLCQIRDGACYAQKGENKNTRNVLKNRWQTDLMTTQMLQQYQHGNKKPMKQYFNLIEKYIQLGNAYAKNKLKDEIAEMERIFKRPLTKEELHYAQAKCNQYKITDVRLNETGDFHCQLAVDLWSKFADRIKNKYGINTHAYTARNLDFSDASKHMAINASHEGINMGEEPERKFKAVANEFYSKLKQTQVINGQPKLSVLNGTFYYKCPCQSEDPACDICGVCFNRNKTGKPYTIYVEYHGVGVASGLTNLFKSDEIKNVMDTMYQNGWITDEEYEVYTSKKNKRNMAKRDANIDDKRRKTKTHVKESIIKRLINDTTKFFLKG